MYEDITYEDILDRMLSRVSDSFDKREGSIIYDALAPAAIEMQEMYIQLDVVLAETFADTASREYLIKRAAERGLIPESTSFAVLKGTFNIDVPIGSRFSLDTLNYAVTEKISDGIFKLTCETAGSAANTNLGTLIPIDYIDGLTTAKLSEVLVLGQDEEDTEVFRARYFDSFISQAFGGNLADYKKKVKTLTGVGGVKVYPAWNGGGTVKIVLTNSSFDVPTASIVTNVQNAIDPIQNSGQGVGIAPIGHVVTIAPATCETIPIASTYTFQTNFTWADVKGNVENAIDTYFDELNQKWEDVGNIIVRISQLESRILNVEGVLDVSATTMGGVAANYTASSNAVVKRGVVSG